MHALINMDVETFMGIHQFGAHPWAAAGLEAMIKKRKWWPLKSEFLVGDLATGLCTPIDQLACTRNGTIIAIETKTGYAGGNFLRTDGFKWSTPLLVKLAERGVWPCTPKFRAMLQLMMGADMFMRMFVPPIPLSRLRLFVMHICSSAAEKVNFVPVPMKLFASIIPYLRRDFLKPRKK